MAAQAFKLYNRAKRKIGAASLSLAATVFRLSLVTSASNFATATLSTFSQLTGEIADGNGYSTSGKALANETYTAGASAGQMRFDADDVIFTATGGNIANIKGAVVWLSAASVNGRHLLGYMSLTSSQFTLSIGNTLTVQFNSAGIFTLA